LVLQDAQNTSILAFQQAKAIDTVQMYKLFDFD
jgi:hypothetical protein